MLRTVLGKISAHPHTTLYTTLGEVDRSNRPAREFLQKHPSTCPANC